MSSVDLWRILAIFVCSAVNNVQSTGQLHIDLDTRVVIYRSKFFNQ